MKKRVISACVFASIGIACFIIGWWAFRALILLLVAVGQFEILRGFRNKGYRPSFLFAFLYWCVFLLWMIFGCNPNGIYFTETGPLAGYNMTLPLLVVITMAMLLKTVVQFDGYSFADCGITVMSAVYPGLLAMFAVLLRNMDNGLWYLLVCMIGAVSADTFAFFIGSKFGKHKLIPSVSPNKTVEGSVAGFAGSAVLVLLCGVIANIAGFGSEIGIIHYLILGLFTGILAQFGDLVESAAKRHLGIKDFGKIIPGHGGIMDRIDSYIFTFPLFYLYISLLLM